MGIGRIASFLSSLSPAAEAASAAASAEQVPSESERRVDSASAQTNLDNDRRRSETSDIAAQLQTMVGAVRALNETAAQLGGAVAVSSTGNDLHNAVIGLGHLLAAVDAQAMAHGASAPVREAGGVIDAVEKGLAASQTAAEQVMRNLPPAQALHAQEVSARFQAQMRGAIRQVRDALGKISFAE